MRTAVGILIGVVVGAVVGAVVAGGAFVAFDRREALRPAAAVGPPIAPPADANPTGIDAPSRPTLPAYRPAAAAPPAAPTAIYRCRSPRGTTYSNEPCDGGRVVDPSSAVVGYDTRPSDRLTRQVAEGRVIADARQTPVYRTPQDPPPATRDCRTMRRQIEDIDARTLQPIDQRSVDDLRAVRQDIRTSMARLHC